ncbi:hypothetical protein HBZS_120460 [Helicobacter bizzozeronii CCUG 35545]|nr:hypothetical protein HBZS_120460 [Helicobacter bizzozeronii CCUG 35545]
MNKKAVFDPHGCAQKLHDLNAFRILQIPHAHLFHQEQDGEHHHQHAKNHDTFF